MKSLFIFLLWPVVAGIAYLVINYVVTRQRRAALAKKLGCQPAPTYPQRNPYLDVLAAQEVKEVFAENEKGRLLQLVTERMARANRSEGRDDLLTMQTHIAQNWFFFTCDPANVQAILATQFKDFSLGPIRYGTFHPMLGNGIFSVDGARWEHSRAMLRPQFVRDQISDLDLEEKHLQNLMQALPAKGGDWTPVIDLSPLFFRLTMDSASEFLFGKSVNSQLAALPGASGQQRAEDAEFVRAFEEGQDGIARAFRLTEWYKLALNKKFYQDCDSVHRYIDRIIRGLMHGDKSSNEKEKYIFARELFSATQDTVEIRDQLLSIMVAGRDTTASLLSWLFLMLSQHPETFRRLRQVVLDDFGTYTKPKQITFAKLKACHYLQWSLNETLRLFPSVPMNSRRSVVDTTIPRGGGPDGKAPVFVPKGTEVNYSVYMMHRHPQIWGPDSNEFRPERFDGLKSGFEYLPFNGGPRICLGQQFALTKAGYMTVRLLQRFDAIDGTVLRGAADEWFLHLTGRPMHGCQVRLHAAAAES